MKKIVLFFMLILMLFIFTACKSNESIEIIDSDMILGENIENTSIPVFEEPTKTDYSDILTTDSIDLLLNTTTSLSETTELTPEDIVSSITAFESAANMWYINDETKKSFLKGEIDYLIPDLFYDGNPITLYCQLTNGGYEKTEYGLYMDINGVRQNFNVKYKDTEANNINMFKVVLEKNEVAVIEFTFEPNIGKKGDVQELTLTQMPEPSFLVTDSSKIQYYGLVHMEFSSAALKIIMGKDAENVEKICEKYSETETSNINSLIFKFHENEPGGYDNGVGKSIHCALYEKITDLFSVDLHGLTWNNSLELKKSQNSEIYLNIHGKEGKYRISFYVNNELMPVFDGCSYTDIYVKNREQTELKLIIDTTNLPVLAIIPFV